jgi:hypothetical protein
VLDAGAGHGAMSRTLHELGFQVTALDFNKELYQCKEVRLWKQISPNHCLSLMLLLKLSLPWGLEHITAAKVFTGIYAGLKPGGFTLYQYSQYSFPEIEVPLLFTVFL